jgi:ribosomal protein L24E
VRTARNPRFVGSAAAENGAEPVQRDPHFGRSLQGEFRIRAARDRPWFPHAPDTAEHSGSGCRQTIQPGGGGPIFVTPDSRMARGANRGTRRPTEKRRASERQNWTNVQKLNLRSVWRPSHRLELVDAVSMHWKRSETMVSRRWKTAKPAGCFRVAAAARKGLRKLWKNRLTHPGPAPGKEGWRKSTRAHIRHPFCFKQVACEVGGCFQAEKTCAFHEKEAGLWGGEFLL